MSNRYLAWTLLIAACGLQAYLVAKGSNYFGDLETIALPFWLASFSKYLFEHYLGLPFYILVILTLALPVLTTILSWVLLGLKRKSGWNLALAVDGFFALPSFALLSINLIYVLRHPHTKLPNNPENLLFSIALLHILIFCSPPIRTLIFPSPAPQARLVTDPSITSAR